MSKQCHKCSNSVKDLREIMYIDMFGICITCDKHNVTTGYISNKTLNDRIARAEKETVLHLQRCTII